MQTSTKGKTYLYIIPLPGIITVNILQLLNWQKAKLYLCVLVRPCCTYAQ